MKVSLKSTGNGWQLYLKKHILKLLKYDPKVVKILISVKDNILFCEPLKDSEESNIDNSLIRNIRKSGSGYAVYIPLSLIEILDMKPETDFIDMQITGDKFTLKKWVEE